MQLRRIGVLVLRRGRSIHQDGRTVMTIMRGLRCLWTASGISLAPVSRKKHEIYLEYPEYYEDEGILEEEEKWLEEFLAQLPTKKKEYFERLIKENNLY